MHHFYTQLNGILPYFKGYYDHSALDHKRPAFGIIYISVTNWYVIDCPVKYKFRTGMMAEVLYHANERIKESLFRDLKINNQGFTI